MRYVVEVNGERREVSLDGEVIRVDGHTLAGTITPIPDTPIHLLRVGSRVYRIVAERQEGRGRYTLWVDGARVEVEALDERTRAIREMTAASAKPSGPAPLTAPMPGLIVRVNVAQGDQVQAGQGLVVMEAMKMENELRASAPGTVRSIRVTPGTAVEKGALLIELE